MTPTLRPVPTFAGFYQSLKAVRWTGK